jgi:TonB family protein
VSGLVVALCYVTEAGEVADAHLLASNTVHLLNLSALTAALDWRFRIARDEAGQPVDGWRILPVQVRLEGEAGLGSAAAGARGVQPPRMVKSDPPEYPERARQKRIEGTVIYQVTVDPGGRLLKAVLVESVHPLLDQAALVVIEQALYAPATRDGTPVEGELLVPVTFPPKN